MKLIKKYKLLISILLIPYIALIIISVYRTDYEVILTGDIEPVNELIEVDTNYEKTGSINSIFIVSYKNSTLLQNLLLQNSNENQVNSIGDTYSHITSAEWSVMSKIQHDQAVEASIITAYKYAMTLDSSIRLDYSLTGGIISWRTKENQVMQIGDIIIGINNSMASDDVELFRENFNNQQLNDILQVRRNNEIINITLNESVYRQYSIYSKYYIDYSSSNPKVKVNNTNVGGPSGGLLQTLAVLNQLVDMDLTHGKTIAGTGTIDINGNVGAIGGVEQKIVTAFKRNVDVFFCPSANYEDALAKYNTIKNKERMKLVEVRNFSDALGYLTNELSNN